MTTKVLVAGVGNVLRRDDGFGIVVAERLAQRDDLPPGVRVIETGIGGVGLVQELMDRCEELVIVAAPMFPHRITRGYDDPNRAVLSEINGVPVKNLRHLVELLRDSRDEQITFKFASLGVLTHETMVFNRTDLMEATVKILEENGIRNPYSADLRAVWETPAQNGHKSAAATCCGAATTAN